MLTELEKLERKYPPRDVKSILHAGHESANDVEMFIGLTEEATSGSEMADVALLQLETMMLPAPKRTDREDQVKVEKLKLFSTLLKHLTTTDKRGRQLTFQNV